MPWSDYLILGVVFLLHNSGKNEWYCWGAKLVTKDL